ncbi:MAG: hypothetical protein KGK07_16390 [Chloroflexota bacterium]|nr:hypothetical protein [Chloroflexota bacterium]
MSLSPDCTVFFEERMNRPCCALGCGHATQLLDERGSSYCELHSPCACEECERCRADEAAYRAPEQAERQAATARGGGA